MEEERQEITTEDKARAMGWVPQDEWRGDSKAWVDADSFVERSEKIGPIRNERIDALTRKISELESSIKSFREYHSKTEQRAYERAMEALKKEMKAAVRAGDEDAFDQIQQRYEQLTKEAAHQTHQPQDPPEFVAWKGNNTWYGSDKQLTALANSIADMLVAERPDLKGDAFLDEVAKQVKEVRPDKFRNTSQDRPAAVHGGESTSGSKPNGKGYRDLPSEARSACDQFVKAGLLSKEQYVKDYFGA